ncbi:MAG: MATE family multidrug resistance protein [Saprospiraceae bacterium]
MNKKILRLAIPNIISNLSVPLLSSVDTAMMGRMESEIYIGAIALGALIFNFVYWSFGFLRMGTTGLTAQAFGEKNNAKLMQILGRAMIFAFGSGLIILVAQFFLLNVGFSILDGSEAVESLAKEYFSIRIWAAPATLCLYAMMGFFFGMQNALVPMVLTIIINVVNLIANIILIQYFDMKADGVALGTVIAQYTGFIIALIIFYKKHGELLVHFQRKAIFEIQAFKKFLSLNRDIFVRTFMLVFAFAFFENQSAAQGNLTLAINSILLQFVAWISYGIDGFAFASESLVGKYAGAKNQEKLRKSINLSFVWAFGLAFTYSLIFYVFDVPLLHLFTNQENLITAAQDYTIWIVLFPILATAGYMWDGVFVGLTASKAMRNTMLWAFIFYIILFYAVDYQLVEMTNFWLWLTFSLFIGIRGIVQTVYYRLYLKNLA